MNRKVPKSLWNILALFFLASSAIAGWLLVEGDISPVVRLAFALCGSLGLLTGSVGQLFYSLDKLLSAFGKRCNGMGRQNLGCWMGIFVFVALVALILAPVFIVAHQRARSAQIASDLKNEGLQLLEYADKHDGILPANMGRGNIYRYIRSTAKGRNYFRGPFVWCGELGGLQVNDVAHPEEVVVAYATERDGLRCPVLYLDGHVKNAHSRKELRQLLRLRPALIASALQAKTKRDSIQLP